MRTRHVATRSTETSTTTRVSKRSSRSTSIHRGCTNSSMLLRSDYLSLEEARQLPRVEANKTMQACLTRWSMMDNFTQVQAKMEPNWQEYRLTTKTQSATKTWPCSRTTPSSKARS